MIASSNTKARVEVVDDSKDGSIKLQRNPVRRDEAGQGDEDDKGGIQPIDMLVPV